MNLSGRLSLSLGLLLIANAGALAWAAIELRAARSELTAVQSGLTAVTEQLQRIDGEVTRIRIEQPAEHKGPQGLLEKLQAFAPVLQSGRSAEPDSQSAVAEMNAVMKAIRAVGSDAWPLISARLQQIDPKENFDEAKYLLMAALAADPDAGRGFVVEVLHGRKLANARLRIWAADLLIGADRPLAQQALRTILLTESSRGVDPDRAAGANLPILDPAAVAVTGFFNFVLHYLRTEDPQTEETLLTVLGRTQTDVNTLQELVEALGKMKSKRAAKRIQELYLKPPLAQQNPLFLNKCLTALHEILGDEARPFLEEQLGKTDLELVAKTIQSLLGK